MKNKEMEFSEVMAKQEEARSMAEAYIKQQMMDYDSLDFDENLPDIKYKGISVKPIRLEWTEDDDLKLTVSGKIMGVVYDHVSNLDGQSLYELAETMSVLRVSMEEGNV